MLCLCIYPELPKLFIEIVHEFLYPGLDHSKVMVIHLLALGGFRPKESTAGIFEVRSLIIHFPCDEEVFLLRSDRCMNIFRTVISKELQDTESLLIERFH